MDEYQFRQKQSLPYAEKVRLAILRAREFHDKITSEYGANVHVSVGGLDSITLLLFLRKYVDENIPAVSVSELEDKSIQAVHKQLGITPLSSKKSKIEILNEFGFPVISKEKAAKIENLQKPNNPKQTFIHAIMTGEMGKQGGYGLSPKLKLPDKWIKLFGGLYQEHRPDICCKFSNFRVSAQCCKWLKEDPCNEWAKGHNSYPYLGLMASEGGQREQGLVKNGCNYYGKERKSVRSCPFAIFMRDDLLRLAIDVNTPVPGIYGEIVKIDGVLETTGAKRTGCEMCGFGIHIEPRPHRFDRLRQKNPKAWEFWMYKCVPEEWHFEDATTTDKYGNIITYKKKVVTKAYGWGRVLDYIGVKWETPAPPKVIKNSFFDFDYKDGKRNDGILQ